MGLAAWSAAIQRSRRQLFGANRVRRLAALGYLNAHPGEESLRVLSEYVMWEQEPVLRRRGQRMLRRMQTHLE
jgi:hypothetical protein